MPLPQDLPAFAITAAIAVAVVAALGEALHSRRIARVGALAFGPAGRPRRWTRLVAPLRVAAIAVIAWSLVTLVSFDNRSRDRDRDKPATRHLMVLLDVSPSMLLADAGESGNETRNARAAAVLKSVLDRVPGDHVLFSAAGFYTEARMLVKECRDRELLLHLTGGVPLHVTYRPGKTDLLASLNQAGMWMKDWPLRSTTLLVIADGGNAAATGLERMPPSVSDVIVAGLGNPNRGTFIDGHMSRQDSAQLSQVARRLGGMYFDANTRHIPSDALRNLNQEQAGSAKWRTDRRLAALILLAAASACLCLLPLLLESIGSAWRPRAAVPVPNPAPRPAR